MQVYWHNFRPISFNFFIPSIPIPISIDSFHIISHVSLLFIDCTLYPLKSISECSLLTTKKFLAMCNQAARQAPSFSAPSTNIPPFPVTTDIRRATLRFAAAQCYATLISLSLSLSHDPLRRVVVLRPPYLHTPLPPGACYNFMLSIPQCCEYFVSIDVSFVCDVCWQEEFLWKIQRVPSK